VAAVLIGATAVNVAIGADETAEVDQTVRIDAMDVVVTTVVDMGTIETHAIGMEATTETGVATDVTAVVTKVHVVSVTVAINGEAPTGVMTEVNGAAATTAAQAPVTRVVVVTHKAVARVVVVEKEAVKILGATIGVGTTATPVGTLGKVRITPPDRRAFEPPRREDRVRKTTTCSVRCCQTSIRAEQIVEKTSIRLG
jgi:hypothetical protein